MVSAGGINPDEGPSAGYPADAYSIQPHAFGRLAKNDP